jgi:hypothetical protein
MKPLQGIPQVGGFQKKSFLCVDAFSEIFLSVEEKTGEGKRRTTF